MPLSSPPPTKPAVMTKQENNPADVMKDTILSIIDSIVTPLRSTTSAAKKIHVRNIVSNRRLQRSILTVVAFIFFVFFSISFITADRNSALPSSAASMPPKTLSPIANFNQVSKFRGESDPILENHIDAALVNIRIAQAGSYDPSVWPNLIFQTASSLDPKLREAFSTWPRMNPEYQHRLVDDKGGKEFVSTVYASVPEIVETYMTFPQAVLKADLLRYLILYMHGGVYSDLDVYCRKPIHEWVPKKLWESNSDIIVGVEIDEPYITPDTMTAWGWIKSYGLAQYVIVAKPFSKPIRTAIVRTISHAYQLAKSKGKKLPSEIQSYTPNEVFDVSGIGMWTDAVMDSINFRRSDITWSDLHNLKLARRFPTDSGAAIILPIRYFGNGQLHSGAGEFEQTDACVSHLFAKDWQKRWFW
ncbi:uncharacterized protein V1516DRAFT_679427 [Lipomyces oligophaga]|uniref:uncharacterized protein n=1 Tax=Lipomyces oligophaga TaxID=45792 RepID=UPI0034D01686